MTDNRASLTIQLTLSDKVKNVFEYCEMQIPFHNRSMMKNVFILEKVRCDVWDID